MRRVWNRLTGQYESRPESWELPRTANRGRGRSRREPQGRSFDGSRWTPPPSKHRTLNASVEPPYGEKVWLLQSHEELPHNLVGQIPDQLEYEFRRVNYHQGGTGCIVFFRGTSYDVPFDKLVRSD